MRKYKMKGLETASEINENVNKLTNTKYEPTPGLKTSGKVNTRVGKMSKIKRVKIKLA